MKLIERARLTLVWLRNIGNWTKGFDGWAITLTPVIGTFDLIQYMHGGEASIRLAGLILSGVGLVSVGYGVAKTRRQFGHPSIFVRPLLFLRTFPSFPRPISATLNATLAGATGRATGFLSSSTEGLTLEQRLERLEKDAIELRSELYRARAAIDQRFNEQSEVIATEKNERNEIVNRLHKEIETTATGGLDQSLYGLVWLFFGSIYTTMPVEMCKIFQAIHLWPHAGVCG